MTLVRSALLLAGLVLAGAAAVAAQGQAPAPAAKVWSDAELDKLMKDIAATAGALRKGVDGQNLEVSKEQSEKLENLFESVDDFFMARNVKDAAEWADDAAEYADRVEDAIDAKDFAKAAENVKLVQSTCAGCHGKYRDKGPDGTYRIKP